LRVFTDLIYEAFFSGNLQHVPSSIKMWSHVE